MHFILLLITLGVFGAAAWFESLTLAAAMVVVYLAVGYVFFGLTHLAFLADPVTLISLTVLSLAIGTVWSLYKWRRWMHSSRVQRALHDAKHSFDCTHKGKTPSTPFKESIYFPNEARASKHIERIATWIILWPFSMIVYFFDDFLMDIGRWIYNRLGKVYARITDAALPDDMK